MQDNTATQLEGHGKMPEQSRQTLCPNCGTGFRVTDAQLKLAEGQVRCGSCLQIFQADQHWFDDSSAASEPTEPTATAANEQSEAAESAEAPEADKLEFSDDFLALDGNDEKPDTLAQAAAEADAEEDDEEWARQILEQEEQSSRGPTNELLDAIMDAPTREDDLSTSEDEQAQQEVDYAQSEFQSTEGWMTELLGDSDEEAFETLSTTLPAQEAPAGELKEPDQEYVPEIFREKKDLLAGIQAEPLEMYIGRHIRPWMKHGLLLLCIVLAGLLLAAQYTWHNSVHLAHNPAYRDFISGFCEKTACAMPTVHDISNIKNSNLVVLKHPRAANALLLDTIITNYAAFEQAYPALFVEFSDLQGQAVASRIFTPAEYLRGDLVGATMMPVRQPIHLSLELADPGERAVNYKIELLAP